MKLKRYIAGAALAAGLMLSVNAVQAQFGYGPRDYGDYYGYYGMGPGAYGRFDPGLSDRFDVGVYEPGEFGNDTNTWPYLGDPGFTGGFYGDGFADDDWFYDYYDRPYGPGYRDYSGWWYGDY